jgi:UDP-N-acetylglucosamine--N-acetylmuramyl-(pentapeptide) pyrophosphoryl-undecaprenol N-acetylglucosamine transferase
VRIWISGGGTGGHVYPGLAVVEALQAARSQGTSGPAAEPDAICWIGSEGGVERDLVARAGLPFQAIAAGGLHGLAPWTAARNLVRLARGAMQVWKLSQEWKPEVLLVTGGFVSAPVALVCWLRRVPILVYLPDIEPGLAVRFVSRFAARIAVTAEPSRSFLPAHKVVVTGYPVRQELIRARSARDQGRTHLGLETSLKTVLVFGGSKGARSLNRALGQVLDQVLARWQVVHISGTLDSGAAQARREMLSQELKSRYKLFAYLHGEEMGMALAAADVIVSRAGASVLGELPLMGLPAILVPYPFAWRYQKVNADYMVEQGAAVVLDDQGLGEGLLPALTSLLGDEARWAAMRERASSLARPDAASALAQQLRALVADSPRGRKRHDEAQ